MEFSEITDTSGEDSGSGGDREAIQERPRPLRRFAGIIVSSTWFGWCDRDRVSFVMIAGAGDSAMLQGSN